MRFIELLMYFIVYGFEVFGLALILIGAIGVITKKYDNKLCNKIYKTFFEIDEEV